eukprot:2882126-Pleurochrysis_carterae.AAC.4
MPRYAESTKRSGRSNALGLPFGLCTTCFWALSAADCSCVWSVSFDSRLGLRTCSQAEVDAQAQPPMESRFEAAADVEVDMDAPVDGEEFEMMQE